MTSKIDLRPLADELFRAETSRQPIPSLTDRHPELTYAEGHEIQEMNAGRRRAEGQRPVGFKIGLTSREARRQFGVFQPDFGHLFDCMAVDDEGEVNSRELIHPRIEGEIAFVLGKDLQGPGITLVDVVKAVDYATVSMEIVDPRYATPKIKIADLVSDNGASSRYVLGSIKRKIDDLELSSIGMALYRNGEVHSTGSGAAVLGNPLSSITFLANELGKKHRGLKAGDLILSGSFSALIPVAPGDFYRCEMLHLGSVSVRFNQGEA